MSRPKHTTCEPQREPESLTPCLALPFLPPAAEPVSAQEATYRLPPPEIVRILEAEPTPEVDFSPDARWMLFIERPAMPSIADVTRPWVGLAGVRIDPA